MSDAPQVSREWATGFALPPALTVSEWADAHRMLPETSAARGARWRTSTAPYLAGIMNVIHEPDIRKGALMKCHQSGGSEALNNIIGYCIEHDPCPMLAVHPTAGAAEAFSKERLSDMIRSTPALRSVVSDARVPGTDGRPENTLSLKMFPGGFLALGGANTPNTFARWSVRLAIGDDVDRFPPVVGDEGDPAELLVNRTTTFHDRLSLFVSTPTLKGGRIDSLYERSDKRRFHVTCPVCGRADYVTWSDETHFRVAFDDRDPATARIECPSEEHGGCGYRIYERERGELVASGIWRATAEVQEAGLAGFHVPAMLSPWVTLSELVEKFLVARKSGREAFKVFVNTMLGEPWDDRTARMEAHQLMVRLEEYGDLPGEIPVEVPPPAVALTAGVDVQKDGFLLLVCGWGPASERWVVDWRRIPGDPKDADTRANLLEALTRRYQHASGQLLPIHATCIDSGYAADEVYSFVLAHQARRIYATKGQAGKSGEPLVCKVTPPSSSGQTRRGRSAAVPRAARRTVNLYNVNVDDAKAMVMSSLALVAPGPNYIHFPSRVETVDSEFFSQLCAEHRESRYNKGGVSTSSVWVQDREDNHAFDAMVLSLVAFHLLRPNLRDMAARILAVQPTAKPEAPPSVDATPAPARAIPAAPQPARRAAPRRVWRSSYLG
jgi:phage terminase large subunit GpA-like protein